MLAVVKGKDRGIKSILRENDRLYLDSEAGRYRLEPETARTVRITYTQREQFSDWKKPGVLLREPWSKWEYEEEEDGILFCTEELCIRIDKRTASFRYFSADGKLLLKERERESKTLEEFPVYVPTGEGMRIEKVATPDGTKEVVREAERERAGSLYHTRFYPEWQEGEALYGLGQHEEGFLNLRGQTVYVHQANRKIALPVLVSNLGYGLLLDTYSPMIFQDTAYGSYLYTEADVELDYYFMYGGTMDGVIREYRTLTGKAALLPKWAFGYLQSQERYETEEEILSVAEEFRNRGIGLDALILDWCSWEGDLWGQKTLDSARFPHPAEMIQALHEKQIHFMISIWPNMSEKSENYKEFEEKKLLLPGSSIYNALLPEGRKLYWEQVKRGLFSYGIDAWWCDSSEPFTPEWNHPEQVEPGRMYEEYCRTASLHLPAEQGNAYALYHAQAIYEGQRAEENGNEKRVVNLTRSGYTGQQRYGTILWSGDIAASWETLKKQIAAGLGFSASGMPYWTTDIGAFFVKEGGLWYWKGDYPETTADMGYRELFVRWYQWACFLPVFRGHGTDCRRELWNFGGPGEAFYEALLAANRLRYELMPYLYSLAGLVWLDDGSIIKPLAFEFPEDRTALGIKDQYLFGNALMVCPVTHPMYYEKNSERLENIPEYRKVYLPEGSGWYEYRSRRYYEGGQWISCEAPLEKLPLFVREGSIVPRTFPAQSVAGLTEELFLDVYTGKDGEFTLYEDAGDGYGYENGEYQTVTLYWNEQAQKLSMDNEEFFKDRKVTIGLICKESKERS